MYANKACAVAPAVVRVFGESVSDSTNRSITLLRAIEQTVDWLRLLQDRAKADSAFASKAADQIKDCERVKAIDPDGTIAALLEATEEALQRLHHLLIAKRELARGAPELDGDNKEAVVEEYTNTIACIADLHNQMTELRWALSEYDADLEVPTGEPIATQEELKAFLEKL